MSENVNGSNGNVVNSKLTYFEKNLTELWNQYNSLKKEFFQEVVNTTQKYTELKTATNGSVGRLTENDIQINERIEKHKNEVLEKIAENKTTIARIDKECLQMRSDVAQIMKIETKIDGMEDRILTKMQKSTYVIGGVFAGFFTVTTLIITLVFKFWGGTP